MSTARWLILCALLFGIGCLVGADHQVTSDRQRSAVPQNYWRPCITPAAVKRLYYAYGEQTRRLQR